MKQKENRRGHIIAAHAVYRGGRLAGLT